MILNNEILLGTKSLFGTHGIDLVLVVAAVVTSIVGSTMQITHKTLNTNVSNKEIVAIYTTGIAIGILAYIVGDLKENIIYTMLIGVFGSYMSLDLFKYAKAAVLAIIQKSPDFFWEMVREKLKSRDEKNK